MSNKKFWTQVFVDYSKNVDFINYVTQHFTVEVEGYHSQSGTFEYIVYSEDEGSLVELTYEFQGENYQYESSNLTDPAH